MSVSLYTYITFWFAYSVALSWTSDYCYIYWSFWLFFCPNFKIPSILAQLPTRVDQPMMELIMTTWSWMTTSSRTMLFLILEPAPTKAYLPIVTFGPMTASWWIWAVGWMQTSPMIYSGLIVFGKVRTSLSYLE